jgi:ethanolamine utilization protein EutA
MQNSIAKEKTIIIIFENDMGKLFGITMRDKTSVKSNMICLDELKLEAGDWIDIGTPLKSTQAFPVTVKSLVFNQDKQYSQEG